MHIVTVNIPLKDIVRCARLVGDTGMYPSRSELFRVAIQNFLKKEIQRLHQVYQPAEVDLKEIVKEAQKKYNQFNGITQ